MGMLIKHPPRHHTVAFETRSLALLADSFHYVRKDLDLHNGLSGYLPANYAQRSMTSLASSLPYQLFTFVSSVSLQLMAQLFKTDAPRSYPIEHESLGDYLLAGRGPRYWAPSSMAYSSWLSASASSCSLSNASFPCRVCPRNQPLPSPLCLFAPLAFSSIMLRNYNTQLSKTLSMFSSWGVSALASTYSVFWFCTVRITPSYSAPVP